MSFEPQKFFIGMLDFFTILLPGAVLTFLIENKIGSIVLGDLYTTLQGVKGWAAFLFASYLLGHFLFLLGSLLDDLIYAPLRTRTDKEHITRLLSGRNGLTWPTRCLAYLCFKKSPDAAIDRVEHIKEYYLQRINAPDTINAFQWCKARLAVGHPEALTTVNRFEADSKFFRSFVPVLLVILAASVIDGQWLFSHATPGVLWGLRIGSALLLALGLWRYIEQRFKATQQAYWSVLTWEAEKPGDSGTIPPSQQASEGTHDQPSHAGGVVFRRHAGRTQYLLVRAKHDVNQWVLPKGHIKPHEDTRSCAIREVKEETGLWARIIGPDKLEDVKYKSGGKPIHVRFYLMEAVQKGWMTERWREPTWLSVDEAIANATHEETKALLESAETQERQREPQHRRSR